jgi:hypothetical protein
LECSLRLSVLAESNVPAIRIERVDVREVIDDAGQEIPLLRTPLYPQFRNKACPVEISLKPGAEVRAIARIKGDILIAVQTKTAVLEMGGLENGSVARKQAGPLDCAVKVSLVESTCNLDVNFYDRRYDPALLDVTRKNVYTTRPVLFDAAGREFSMSSSGSGGFVRDRFSFPYNERFLWQSSKGLRDRPQLPMKLIWRLPAESKMIRLPFEFNDLPLPGRDLKMRA